MEYPKYNYLIFPALIGLLFFLFDAKQKPTYNPFDDLFQVDVQQLRRDGCDTVPAGCGYDNLANLD